MAVTKTTLRLTAKLRADLLQITNGHDRALTKAWVEAWDVVAGDLELEIARLIINSNEGTVTQAQALRASRLQKALDAVSSELTRLVENAGSTITSDLARIVREAGQAQSDIIGSQLPKDQRGQLISWDRVDADQISAIVKRSTERITAELWPISTEVDAVIRRELVRGIAAGANPRQTAARMIKNAEGGFNGGLSRALNIARTETLDAHRAAAAASHDANSDVLAGWIWLTSLSGRTCPACLGMSGTEHKLSEPGPLGHQSCRCSRMPKTKTWRDLGIDIDEPESTLPNAEDWFNGQDAATQKDILGAGRYDAWKRGDYPIDKWAVRKTNPDWRPSYVTSPLAS